MSACEQYTDEVALASGEVFVKRWQPNQLNSAQPLILLHESLGSVAQWRDFPQHLALALSRPVIAYDRLGFGKSSAVEELLDEHFIREEALHDFPQLKAALGLKQYALMGHSIGGAMAVAIAASDADCKAIITVGTQGKTQAKTLAGIAAAKELFKQAEQMQRLRRWHGDKAEWVLNAWTEVWLSAEFADWSLEYCRGKFECPLLALHGEDDEYGSSEAAEYIAALSPDGSQVQVLANCGHVPHKDNPDLVIQHCTDFLQRLAGLSNPSKQEIQ